MKRNNSHQSIDHLLPLAQQSNETLLEKYQTTTKGLFSDQAKKFLEKYGYNEPVKKKKTNFFAQFISKFFNPLVIVLLVIAGFSLFFGERTSAILVILMAIMSVLLSFIQEYKAGQEAEKLSEMVKATATVYRDGRAHEIKMRDIVPGDIVDLFAGDMIPADLRILSSKDLFINQSSLTGESFPIEKTFGPLPGTPQALTDLSNIAFMGSSVISGTGLGLVIQTGIRTQFGEMAKRLTTLRVRTSFDKGIHSFTWLMISTMLIMVAVIFLINSFFRHDTIIEALLFSLAVAVGLTPEMLPMIVTLNLSKGAIAMSKKQVIVKRLNAIQNLGAMDVLCTDKTGTLTRDQIILEKHCDISGKEDEDVLTFAHINSYYQTGLKNILDKAILRHEKMSVKQYKKIDEIPFDFSRKIMSVVVEQNDQHLLIAKGAPEEIFKCCTKYELGGSIYQIKPGILDNLKNEYNKLSAEGFRVLAVAYKNIPTTKSVYAKEDESTLILRGYLAFLDPPKPSARRAIYVLKRLGVDFKVLTGDNELVTKYICSKVGLDVKGMVIGQDIDKLNNQELQELVKTTNVFARLSPLQKERIVNALHDNKHIVGFLGDGINDAPALKAADVGISVDNAVDIAKESADIILLKKSLMVLEDGVLEGRKTFGNITKYIKMGSSSNFGNMLSMTGASLFLPFLPMLPIQILFNNFLYDISQVAIPTDQVDKEYLAQPRPWDIAAIKKFMMVFGPISSLFDFMTYGVLLFMFHAPASLFHTGWFIESLCTQTLVIYVIRTTKIPFIESSPSKFLMITSLCVISMGILACITPLAQHLGFVTPPWAYFSVLINILIAYLFMVQLAKQWFVKKYGMN
jgi:Mg2+-importing ATPase